MNIMRPVDSDDSDIPRFMIMYASHCQSRRLTGTVSRLAARRPGTVTVPLAVIGVIGPSPGVADSESVSETSHP